MIVTELPGAKQRVSSARRILSERMLNSPPLRSYPVLIRKPSVPIPVDSMDPVDPVELVDSVDSPDSPVELIDAEPLVKTRTQPEHFDGLEPCAESPNLADSPDVTELRQCEIDSLSVSRAVDCECDECTKLDPVNTVAPLFSLENALADYDSDFEPGLRCELDSEPDYEPAAFEDLCDDSETDCDHGDYVVTPVCDAEYDTESDTDFQLFTPVHIPSPPPSAYLGAATQPRKSFLGNHRFSEVSGGDLVFREFMVSITAKLELALGANSKVPDPRFDDSRYLFRDFAGHMAIAFERFGPGQPGEVHAPPATTWVIPLILPWLQLNEDAIQSCILAFEEVCGWMGTLTQWLGGTELLQSTVWDSLVDLMYLRREDVGDVALRAALTILDAAGLSPDTLCRVVLLRHVTLNFESERLAPFRRRRLLLMNAVVQRVEQNLYEPETTGILAEASRELERAAVTEHDALASRMVDDLVRKVRILRSQVGIGTPATLPSPATMHRFSMCSMRTFRSEARPPAATPARKSRRWRRFLNPRRWLRRQPPAPEADDDTTSMISALSTATRRYAMLQSGVSPDQKSPMTV